MDKLNIISGNILDCSIEVHRNIGPGLLESVYELCLCREFDLRKIRYRKQVLVPINYKGIFINANLRVDILVEDEIIVELKSIEALNTIHTAQLLSYLKLMNKNLGLLINFNVPKLIDGFKRIIN